MPMQLTPASTTPMLAMRMWTLRGRSSLVTCDLIFSTQLARDGKVQQIKSFSDFSKVAIWLPPARANLLPLTSLHRRGHGSRIVATDFCVGTTEVPDARRSFRYQENSGTCRRRLSAGGLRVTSAHF